MPDRTTMPDFSDELRRLQRRAYGPAAQGALDAADLARLRELEALVRASSDPAHDHTPPAGDAGAEADADGSVSRHAGGDTEAVPTPPPNPGVAGVGPRIGGWRAAAIAAAAVTGCAVGGAGVAVAVAPPAPDAVLRPIADSEIPSDFDQNGILDFLRIDRETGITAYDPHRGVRAFTFTGTDGTPCLIVSVDADFFDYACGHGRLDPTLDLMPGRTAPATIASDLSKAVFVRLVARDGTVQIWVEDRPG
ncbi:hypothetical protein QNO21_07330 [Microbacterium sp. zg-Y818]|uniref:hypothetical protein n=1 Tax=unclassified Microbacterium TaxID=2609290 RepID=UPI00214BB743|nr:MULTISPECIES: hypothetical protein [unclassified Microbacterium]MCR2801116.1 hypothetical protein [Microbacterium sp. zg.Y818]WIM23816.1 hypothetical protein QNO21_07330 [Microbacterium sp. zg-Y818]